MQLYIKQRVFSWRQKFDIYDMNMQPVFFCQADFFTLGKKLSVYDRNETEVIRISQKLFTLLPEYEIYIEGRYWTSIRKKFTFFTHDFFFKDGNIKVYGHPFAHDYQMIENDRVIMYLNKTWLSWGDTYRLDIVNLNDTLYALATAIVIDCVCHEGGNHH